MSIKKVAGDARITCFTCGAVCSSGLPWDVVFRGTATCPECTAREPDLNVKVEVSRPHGPQWGCSRCSRRIARQERFILNNKEVICVECFARQLRRPPVPQVHIAPDLAQLLHAGDRLMAATKQLTVTTIASASAASEETLQAVREFQSAILGLAHQTTEED